MTAFAFAVGHLRHSAFSASSVHFCCVELLYKQGNVGTALMHRSGAYLLVFLLVLLRLVFSPGKGHHQMGDVSFFLVHDPHINTIRSHLSVFCKQGAFSFIAISWLWSYLGVPGRCFQRSSKKRIEEPHCVLRGMYPEPIHSNLLLHWPFPHILHLISCG